MKFDDHIFVSVGYNDRVYHLAEPAVWYSEDCKTLDGIRVPTATTFRTYPRHITRFRMATLYQYLRPCKRCEKIQRIRDAK